jgi:surfeit locus 1 family protein
VIPRANATRARSGAALAAMGLCLLGVFAGFIALGNWQMARRTWKLELIDRVEHRIHAEPVPAPPPSAWRGISAAGDEYRRVRISGTFENDRETLVQAVTDWGGGYWVLTPLRADAGFEVLVNRGFVPADRADPAARTAGQVSGETTVTGLLRISEPKGGFLRANNPAAGRWYSRDVAAIARARGLSDAAPYFIDADAAPNRGGWPLGGLTVVAFPNSHLAYALTWYGLALMTALGGGILIREQWRRSVEPVQRLAAQSAGLGD